MKRISRAFGAVALVLVAAGCASVTDGTGSASGPGRSTSQSTHASTPVAPPSTPSRSSTTTPPGGGPEFGRIGYTIPAGFGAIPSSLIGQQVSIEQDQQFAYYITPGGRPEVANGIVSVLVYTLPAGTKVATEAEQRARVAYYDKLTKFSAKTPLRSVTVAGRPALVEFGTQPDPSQPPFRYTAWYIFGQTHVMQIACQFGTTTAGDPVMKAGCAKFIPTITIS